MTGHEVVPGFKQAFCVEDLNKWDPNAGPLKFTCDAEGLRDQGISPGWEDIYISGLSCQYIIIDGVPDGDYQLLATTNAQRIVAEDTFSDNTVRVGLRIHGNTVVETATPAPPPHLSNFVQIIFGVIQDGGGLTTRGPVPPRQEVRDMLMGILVAEIARSVSGAAAHEIERAAMRLVAKVAQAEAR